MSGRTFVIGDVHGERAMLAQLLAALPFIAPADALPWQSGEDGGVFALVGHLKKCRQCRQRRCLEQPMQ